MFFVSYKSWAMSNETERSEVAYFEALFNIISKHGELTGF